MPTPHVHLSPIHVLITLISVVAVFGTLRLVFMAFHDTRFGRAGTALNL